MTERIVIDPEICNGRPTIRGTRITAQTVLGHLSAGDSIEDVLDAYPRLTRGMYWQHWLMAQCSAATA